MSEKRPGFMIQYYGFCALYRVSQDYSSVYLCSRHNRFIFDGKLGNDHVWRIQVIPDLIGKKPNQAQVGAKKHFSLPVPEAGIENNSLLGNPSSLLYRRTERESGAKTAWIILIKPSLVEIHRLFFIITQDTIYTADGISFSL